MAGVNQYEYQRKLTTRLRQPVVHCVRPTAVLKLFHVLNDKVLTLADLQKIEAVTDREGDMAGTQLLLDRLPYYEGWFECLLSVLRHPDVMLSHVADILENERAALDRELTPDMMTSDSTLSTEDRDELRDNR